MERANGRLVDRKFGAGIHRSRFRHGNGHYVDGASTKGRQHRGTFGFDGQCQRGQRSVSVSSVSSSTAFQIGQGALPANTTLGDATLAVTANRGKRGRRHVGVIHRDPIERLFLRDQTFWTAGGTNLYDLTLPTEYLTVSVKGWCSGTCAGEDAKIQACLTINGVTCWPTNATAKYQEVALGTSPTKHIRDLGDGGSAAGCVDAGGIQPAEPRRPLLASRHGECRRERRCNLDAGRLPEYVFQPKLDSGSKILIAGSECKIVQMGGLTQLTIDPASCSAPLSLPLTGAAFTGSNFGFLVRKKTASTDTINLQYAKYTTGTSQYIDFTASGSANVVQRHADAEQRDRRIGVPLRDSERLAPSVLGRPQDGRRYLPGTVYQFPGQAVRTDFRAGVVTEAARWWERRQRAGEVLLHGNR
jgi:hypothetical protein